MKTAEDKKMTFRAALELHYNSFHVIYIMQDLERAGLHFGLCGEPRQTDVLSNYDMAWWYSTVPHDAGVKYFSECPIGA
jgi:hypothetical protein